MGNSIQQIRIRPGKAALIRVFGFFAFLTTFAVLATGCVQQPLPEAASPAALLYSGKCSLCHKPFHPQTHTYTGWKKVITRMEQNAEVKGINQLLSEDERASVLAYLEKNARKGF